MIILKGLDKSKKLEWVKSQGLENYFLDIEVIRKLYSSPELIYPGKSALNKAFIDVVYTRYIEAVCLRLSKGCLVVLDIDTESINIFEILAMIFGYTTFYTVQDIPEDYIKNYLKYNPNYYTPKSKSELEKEVSDYLKLQIYDKKVIQSYQDIINYWRADTKQNGQLTVQENDSVLHVSDIHSHYSLFKHKLPKRKNYKLVICYGDYIDGPEKGGSRNMIDFILNDKSTNTIWLEGNHELRLRRYLGSIYLRSIGKDVIADMLYSHIPQDFLATTAKEFKKISSTTAKEYLEGMNRKLRSFFIINTNDTQYICSHAGIKYKEQLNPMYIGSIIYGNRDMNRYDKIASNYCIKGNYWSIHAHCKYPDFWEVNRFENVINLDPIDEYRIIYVELKNKNWNICQIIEKQQ